LRELYNDYLARVKKTVIFTHFPPTRRGTSHATYLAEYRINNLYFTWPNDSLDKFNLSNVVACISGVMILNKMG